GLPPARAAARLAAVAAPTGRRSSPRRSPFAPGAVLPPGTPPPTGHCSPPGGSGQRRAAAAAGRPLLRAPRPYAPDTVGRAPPLHQLLARIPEPAAAGLPGPPLGAAVGVHRPRTGPAPPARTARPRRRPRPRGAARHPPKEAGPRAIPPALRPRVERRAQCPW